MPSRQCRSEPAPTAADILALIPAPRAPQRWCCGRPMTRIEVIDAAHHLLLDTCAPCGAHAWTRDGVPLDRAGVLDTVRARLAESPPRGRWAAKRSAAVSAGEQAAARLQARGGA